MSPTLINYLRSILGRDGVPLSNFIRDSIQPDLTQSEDFIDECVSMIPIGCSKIYGIYKAEIQTLLVK